MKNTTLFRRPFVFLLGLLWSMILCQAQIPRYLITTIPEQLEDNDQPVTIIYDASQGNAALNLYDGIMYAHTGVTTETGPWQYTKTDTDCPMTKMGDNKWKITFPKGIRSYYGITSPTENITQICILFRNNVGDKWGKGSFGDGNILIPIGKLITTVPAYPNVDEPVVVTFNANFSNPKDGNAGLKGYTGDVYAHTGVTIGNMDWQHGTSWSQNSDKYKMTNLGCNKWQLVIPNGLRDFYGTSAAEEIQKMNFVFRSSDGTKQSENIFVDVQPDFVQTSLPFPTETGDITFTFNTAAGDQGLKDAVAPLYVHTGVTTEKGDWQHATDWATPSAKHQLTSSGTNKWILTMAGGIRTFYEVPAGEAIKRISFVLRNADGSKQSKNADGSDVFVKVYSGDLAVRFDSPKRTITVKPNEKFRYKITASSSASLSLKDGSTSIGSPITGTVLSGEHSFATVGTHTLTATATATGKTATDELTVIVQDNTVDESMPTGMTLPGIHYYPDDPTKVTLVLEAPYKQNAYLIGDFNNWQYNSTYQMKREGEKFWITLTGLNAKQEYAYQYVVDGTIYIADPYTEKVLDSGNDSYIPVTTYPNLKPYPTGASGIVSVFQTGQEVYSWKVSDFKRPDQQDLMIYEMHLRDFTTEGTYKAALTKLPYLKDLGINAIELMPTNEFEGNDSWGYNPSFYFAPDKAYGTEADMKEFIDECHAKGIAVIIDMVLNHSFGQSPLLRLYQDSKGTPLKINPWYNEKSNIENSGLQWGADFNHESFYTRTFVDRVNKHWLTNYKVDGIRYDFTKGFSNTTHPKTSGNEWASTYDEGRIYNVTRMADEIRKCTPGAYVICEHLTEYSEEKKIADHCKDNPIMLWNNMNKPYMVAGMGEQSDGTHGGSDFSRLYDWRSADNMNTNSLVGYMESHDEERIAYQSYTYGVTTIKNSLPTSMKQLATCTAFFLTVPGPKMIWQFGELGYDVSINEGGRTSKKPVKWEYYNDDSRKYLYDVYSKLLYLRQQHPELFRARGNFGDSRYGFSWRVNTADWGNGRMIHSQALDHSMVVVGNFSGVTVDCTADFTNTGTWYDYMNGGTITVNTNSQAVSVPAHEFRLYVNFKPEYRVVHSSDASSSTLSGEQSVLIRSGGWNAAKATALNAALKGTGGDENKVLQTADLTQATMENQITGLFAGCSSLTTLRVPHLDYPYTLLQGANPNCLTFLSKGGTTTQLASWKNVVQGNTALTPIEVDDAYPFYLAQPFSVSDKSVTYTRTFTGASKTGGWETLCLPFVPTDISGESVSTMKPVSESQSGDFWLKEYTSSTPGQVNFTNSASIQANTPYLIAFPGTEWGASNPISWKVKFTANAATFDVTKTTAVTKNDYLFKGSFATVTDDATTPADYMLNTAENKFSKVVNNVLKPFRAYFTDASSGAGPTEGGRMIKSLSIGADNGGITGLANPSSDTEHAWTAYGGKGEIRIHTSRPCEVAIYDLNGQSVYRQHLSEGEMRISVPQGIYIVNKKKVIVY